MKNQNTALFVLVLICALVIALSGVVDLSIGDNYTILDARYYIQIAEEFPDISEKIEHPFAYRILGSILATLLPFNLATNFLILQTLAGFLLAFACYYFLTKAGFSPLYSLTGSLILLFSKKVFPRLMWDIYQLNDTIAAIFYFLIFAELVSQRRIWLLSIYLSISLLAREAGMIILPVLLLSFYESDKKVKLTHLFPLVIPVLVFILLRIFIQDTGNADYFSLLLRYLNYKAESPLVFIYAVFSTFTPFWLLLIFDYRKSVLLLKKKPEYILLLILSIIMLLFAAEVGRLLIIAFPAYLYVLVNILREYFGEKPVGKDLIILAAILFIAFLSIINSRHGLIPFPFENLETLYQVSLTILVLIIVFLKGRKNRILSLN